jgi:hypothetical protein
MPCHPLRPTLGVASSFTGSSHDSHGYLSPKQIRASANLKCTRGLAPRFDLSRFLVFLKVGVRFSASVSVHVALGQRLMRVAFD